MPLVLFSINYFRKKLLFGGLVRYRTRAQRHRSVRTPKQEDKPRRRLGQLRQRERLSLTNRTQRERLPLTNRTRGS